MFNFDYKEKQWCEITHLPFYTRRNIVLDILLQMFILLRDTPARFVCQPCQSLRSCHLIFRPRPVIKFTLVVC